VTGGLVGDLLAGSRRALARMITLVENGGASAEEALAALFAHTGRSHLVGVTGAPGTGKSSLVSQMALTCRRRGQTVGIIAIDPTSPFSGGAILGDRIRMRDVAGDPGVFIRSMASRGSLGGLARATGDVIDVLDAAGFNVVIIETVGAGQSEVDIARYAHTVVVVEAPGMGDDVQAIKAGILEIADVLVVNKADDPRSENTARALRAMLELGQPGPRQVMHHGQIMDLAHAPAANEIEGVQGGWPVPICKTNALSGEGVEALVGLIAAHRDYLQHSGELGQRERARTAAALDDLLRDALLNRLLERIDQEQVAALVNLVASREMPPRQAVARLLQQAGC
jgi:LAO/AO transport system kinase